MIALHKSLTEGPAYTESDPNNQKSWIYSQGGIAKKP